MSPPSPRPSYSVRAAIPLVAPKRSACRAAIRRQASSQSISRSTRPMVLRAAWRASRPPLPLARWRDRSTRTASHGRWRSPPARRSSRGARARDEPSCSHARSPRWPRAASRSSGSLVLTETAANRARLRERVADLLSGSFEEVWIETWPGLGERLLRDYALEAGIDPFFEVAGPADRLALLLDRLDELPLRRHEIRGNPSGLLAGLLERIDALKAEGIGPADLRDRARAAERGAAGRSEREVALRELEFSDLFDRHDQIMLELGMLDENELDPRARPPAQPASRPQRHARRALRVAARRRARGRRPAADRLPAAAGPARQRDRRLRRRSRAGCEPRLRRGGRARVPGRFAAAERIELAGEPAVGRLACSRRRHRRCARARLLPRPARNAGRPRRRR